MNEWIIIFVLSTGLFIYFGLKLKEFLIDQYESAKKGYVVESTLIGGTSGKKVEQNGNNKTKNRKKKKKR